MAGLFDVTSKPTDLNQFGRIMMSLVVVGVLIIFALSVLCFAAYKIRAKSFEVSTSVGKIVSFSIKIISADGGQAAEKGRPGDEVHARPDLNAATLSRHRNLDTERFGSAHDRVELLGRDAWLPGHDEGSLTRAAPATGAGSAESLAADVSDPK